MSDEKFERDTKGYEPWNENDTPLDEMDEEDREEEMDKIERIWERENIRDICGSGRDD